MTFRKINLLLIPLVPILIYLFFVTFYKKIGDLRPAILPSGNVADMIEKESSNGGSTHSPLKLPAGYKLSIFARNLGNIRDLEFSPEGTLIVSITGSGKVVALPDKNKDGKADEVKTILDNLDKPHGITFYSGKLYVVEETRIVRYFWDKDSFSASPDKFLFSLPKGDRHFTRSIVFDKKGAMYVSIGSTCDVCFENHQWLGSVVTSDVDGNNPKLLAKGLRNSVFLTVNPTTDQVWGTEMGRDFLDDNLPPDEINIITAGDYGWPVCYGKGIHDDKFDVSGEYKDRCQGTNQPVYELCAHCAPLGLAFIDSPKFPKDWQGDLLVALHGSWNRSIPVGYKIVKINIEGDKVVGEEDFITGFLKDNQALGRPVDLTFDSEGNLYISDDKAGTIYRVTK